jgi:hypothetical protein
VTEHAYLIFFLQQHLVILAKCHAEDDRRNCLETVDPLFPLASLAANVEHAKASLAKIAYSASSAH